MCEEYDTLRLMVNMDVECFGRGLGPESVQSPESGVWPGLDEVSSTPRSLLCAFVVSWPMALGFLRSSSGCCTEEGTS